MVAIVKFTPSKYQTAIFEWIKSGRGDALVEAVAGSGKTTTLVEASKLISSSRVLFVAFNTHIVKELESRLPQTFTVSTVHSLGYKALQKRFGRLTMDDAKYNKLVKDEVNNITRFTALTERDRSELHDSLKKVSTFCRLTLTDPANIQDLEKMIGEFSIEIDWELFGQIRHSVRRILDNGVLLGKNGKIDFTDMLWLPCHLDLPLTQQFEWIFADEAQDFSNAQRQIVLKARATGGRILFVGDSRQAIMGFAGANAQSFAEIAKQTGAVTLPLSVCYRCPDSHLELAREVVPYCESREGAPVGTVREIPEEKLYAAVGEGDLVLCRLTAPLVSACLALIAQGVPARVRGREIGANLISVLKQVEKHSHYSWGKFDSLLSEWEEWKCRQLAKREGNDEAIQAARDKVAAIRAILQSQPLESLQQLVEAIEKLFSDQRASVWLSTVHRAKGLEADRVFILRPKKLPLQWATQQAWQFEQEQNLRYVALTRAKKELVFCLESPDLGDKEGK